MVLGTNAHSSRRCCRPKLDRSLLITIGAIFFFKETVGPRRWLALAVGATGALVVVRPGFQDLDLGIGLVSLTIIFSAGQRLVSKSLSHTDPSVTSVLYLMFFMLPFTLAASLPVWSWPTIPQLGLMATLGVLLSLAHFAWMRALTYADISALEPIGFTSLMGGAFRISILFRGTNNLDMDRRSHDCWCHIIHRATGGCTKVWLPRKN